MTAVSAFIPDHNATRPALGERATIVRTLFIFSLALLLLPPAIAPIPPLWDYPNHLARLFLLGGGADLPQISPWYRITWDSLTNVALDAIGAHLVPWIGWLATGRLLVVAAILLPPLGAAALARELHGRVHIWLLAAAPLAWSTTLIGGFLNFQIGIGLALLAAASDIKLARSCGPWWLFGRAAIATILIGIHLFGFIFYVALLAGLAIGPSFASPAATIRRLSLLAISLLLPCALFLLAAPSLPGAQVGADTASLLADILEGWHALAANPAAKLRRLFLLVTTYDPALATLSIGLLLLPLILSAALRLLRIHAGLLLVATLLTLCYLATPDRLGGTYWIDARFAVMAPLAAMAALRPDLPAFSSRIVAALLVALATLQTVTVAAIWHQRQADVAALADALKQAEPGRTILPLQLRPTDRTAMPPGRFAVLGGTSYRHLPMLALPWHHDFVPTLFAARGKQPVTVTSAMLPLAEPEGGDLATPEAFRDPVALARDQRVAPYLRNWRQNFDYVLLVNADIGIVYPPLGPADGLTLAADTGFARLYRVTRNTP